MIVPLGQLHEVAGYHFGSLSPRPSSVLGLGFWNLSLDLRIDEGVKKDVARGAEVGEEGPRPDGRGPEAGAAARALPRQAAGRPPAVAPDRRISLPRLPRRRPLSGYPGPAGPVRPPPTPPHTQKKKKFFPFIRYVVFDFLFDAWVCI